MPKRPKKRMSLAQILASCSDTLFPAEMGKAPVTVDSRDVDGDTPLHVMVRRGDAYAVRQLIEAGADVQAVGDMSETPLHIALRLPDLTIAAALLAAGASVTPISEFGQSPQDIATERGGDALKLVKRRRHGPQIGRP